jgi:hypothetical protein
MSLLFQSLFDDSYTVATADSAMSLETKVDYFKYSWLLPIARVANEVFGSLDDDRSIVNTKTSSKLDNQRSGTLNHQARAENKKRRPRSGERSTTKTETSEHPLLTAMKDMLEFGSDVCGSEADDVVKREYRHGKDTPNVSKSHNANENIPRPRRSR